MTFVVDVSWVRCWWDEWVKLVVLKLDEARFLDYRWRRV